MAAVLLFRPQSWRRSGAARLRAKPCAEACEIIIFPGVRRERHADPSAQGEVAAGAGDTGQGAAR